MKIRKAELIDKKKLLDIWDKSGYHVTKKEANEYLDKGFKKSNVFIASEGKKDIGFFIITKEKKEIWINHIYIIKSFQGKGYGKKIISYMINLARKNKLNSVGLAVMSKNFQAIGFYNKLGFEFFNIEKIKGDKMGNKLRMRKIIR